MKTIKDFENMDIIDLIISIESDNLTEDEYKQAVKVAHERVPKQIASKY